jgi:peptidoglycan/LPS O-acetylase OafA/YrhL
MKDESKKLNFVTILRGAAAFVVFTGHLLTMFPSDIRGPSDFYSSSSLRQLLWPMLQGRLMVFLFVTLSGFSLYRSYFSGQEFRINLYFKRRINRIVPIYIIAILLGLIVNFILEKTELVDVNIAPKTTWTGFLSHLLFVQNWNSSWIFQINPPLWSVAVEMQLYFLLPFLVLLKKKLRAPMIYLVVPLIVRFIQSKFFRGFFWFDEWLIAGIISSISFARLRIIFADSIIYILSFLFFFSIYAPNSVPQIIKDGLWMLFAVGLIRYFSAKDISIENPVTKLLYWLGNRSYSLYALHFPTLALTYYLLKEMHTSHSIAIALYLVLGTLLVFLFTEACFRTIESNPKARLFRF